MNNNEKIFNILKESRSNKSVKEYKVPNDYTLRIWFDEYLNDNELNSISSDIIDALRERNIDCVNTGSNGSIFEYKVNDTNYRKVKDIILVNFSEYIRDIEMV